MSYTPTGTGPIMNAVNQVITDMDNALQFQFTTSAAIAAGQEVALNTDGTIKLKAAADYPIGVCIIGAASGGRATIRLNASERLVGAAGAAAINSGVLVTPDGTINANGYPNYIAAVTGNYSRAIAMSVAAAQNATFAILLLEATVKI